MRFFYRIFVVLLLVGFNCPKSSGQATSSTSSQNYIEEKIVLKEHKERSFSSLSRPDIKIIRTYIDGLGRPIQKVGVKESPSGKDIVQPMEYDQYGRQVKSYLPYVHNSNDGAYKADYATAQGLFYNNNTDNNADRVVNDLFPFTEKKMEGTVANQISEQSTPGESWKLGSLHTSKSFETFNVTGDEIQEWILTATGATSTTVYSATTCLRQYILMSLEGK